MEIKKKKAADLWRSVLLRVIYGSTRLLGRLDGSGIHTVHDELYRRFGFTLTKERNGRDTDQKNKLQNTWSLHTHTHTLVCSSVWQEEKKKHMNPPGKKNKIPYFHILFFHIRIKVVRVCVVLILYWHISDEHDDDMNSDY